MAKGLRRELAGKLEPHELALLYSSYDTVGDIAVIRVPESLEHRARDVAEAVIRVNKHIRTVLRQTSPISGDLRLRGLQWVAGEKRTETVHKEHGCLLKVDLERCYFSPRLSHERRRISQQVKQGEVVVNMFSGVGCYSIVIARHCRADKVYSMDINPTAIKYQEENVRLNKVASVVEPILGDAGEIIRERLRNVADRVLMPLPEKAHEYLDYAVLALKPGTGSIHYYDFAHACREEDPVRKTEDRASAKMLGSDYCSEVSSARVVRTVGPRWYQVVLDILVHKKS